MIYKKRLFWFIAISSLIRIIIASTQELGNSEAYYWVLSTKLQWNYFDHPPIVAWLIRLTTVNLLIHNELFVRIGAVVSSGACTWLMFRIGVLLKDERTGWFAALLYATSVYPGVGIGAFILPDSPQMFFWLSALYMLCKIVSARPNAAIPVHYWNLFGCLCGFCIMCKVHGIFIWVGAIAYFLLYDRKRFADKNLYLSLGISVLIALPILIWNFQNHFITYRFHGSRVSIAGSGINFKRFLKQFFQVVFLIGPIHIVLLCVSIYAAMKGRSFLEKKYLRAVLLCSLPLIGILSVVSLFREIYPHWPGPPFSALLILPAIGMAGKPGSTTGKTPIILKGAVAYTLFVALTQVLVTNCFPGTVSEEKSGMKTGDGDPTLDTYGWGAAAARYDSVYSSDVAKRIMPVNAPIIITDWYTAAHIDFYMGHCTGQQTVGLGSVFDLHQYSWMNGDKRPLSKGDSAYYIVPSNTFDYKVFDKTLARFSGYDFALVLPQERNGVFCRAFYFVRLLGFKGPGP